MSILTAQQAAELLNYNSPDEMPEKVTSFFLPSIDGCLQEATGKDWGMITDLYPQISPVAIMAAGILLVRWFEDPGMIGKTNDSTVIGLIGQLKAKVLQESQIS